ncbi:hypothetical protein AZ55_14300 [Mycobacterium tuberculosis CWCFVRF MDRTB 670]|nr:hypothetical protein AZ55_14300 [Mycobacterium tuberculosis CWCFVRF MDRTB 670]
MVIWGFSFADIADLGRAKRRLFREGQIRSPAADTGGLGLRRQGRQPQLQTRLRSMCRRATSAIRRSGRGFLAAVTVTFCHGWRAAARPGQISFHDDQNYATSLDGWIGRPGNPLGDAHLTLTGVTDVTKYDY